MRRSYVVYVLLVLSFVTGSYVVCFAQTQDLENLNSQAIKFFKEGKYAEAVPLAEKYAEATKQQFGENDVKYATALNTLALLYKAQGRYADAELFYKRAMAIYKKTHGPNHLGVATGLNNLGLLYHTQGKYAEAELLYKRSFKIREEKLGPKHPDVALSLNNLAGLYHTQGKYAEAEPLYKRALAIYEKAHGPDHHLIALSLNNLAWLYQAQGRHAEAEPLYKRSLKIREKKLGSDHPRVATGLNNLAGLYLTQGKYAEAEPLFKRALAIYEMAQDPDHVYVATSLNNLALLYYAQGRYTDAEPLYQRALAIDEKAYGPDHVYVATSLNNLAGLYRTQGKYADAEPLFKQSLKILEQRLGPDHPIVALNLNNLAVVCRVLNRHEEAEAYFKRADAIPDPTTRKVRIYFATNRQLEQKEPVAIFGTKRGIRLEMGQANVIVPRKEIVTRTTRLYSGSKPASFVEAKLTAPSRLIVRKINFISEQKAFADKLKETIGRSHRFKNQMVMFVHGFNVSFDEAVSRTAQLCFELDFDGPCLVFTWPSEKKILGYGTDRENADIAVNFLLETLEVLAADLPGAKIHIMAHSMGNMVALEALEKLALKQASRPKITFGELVLAHPDVDRDRFTQLIKKVRPLGGGFTLYASSDDRALWVSEWLRGVARAGGTNVLAEGLDTIDISGLGTHFLSFNHTVFAENPIVFGDITKLLQTSQRPPNLRTKFFEAVDKEGRKYWRYKGITQTATRKRRDLIDVMGD